jgi:uncharacterized protein YjbI with pentapeptide repeats
MPADRHPEAPRLPSSLTAEPDRRRIEDGAELAHREIAGAAWVDVRVAAVRATEVVFRDADLTGSLFVDPAFRDTVFEHPKLANATIRGGSLSRVLIDGGRLTGFHVAETEIRDAVWRACGADMATFRHARLERVTFEDCSLREADFMGTPSSRAPSFADAGWMTSRGSRASAAHRWSSSRWCPSRLRSRAPSGWA